MKNLCLILRLLLGLLFLFAGAQKLLHPLPFADAIASFRILPAILINSVALGLPILEILTTILLIIGLRQGAFLAFSLTAIFSFAFLCAAMRGIEVHCGCFGNWEIFGISTMAGLIRAIVLFVLSGFLYARATPTIQHPLRNRA